MKRIWRERAVILAVLGMVAGASLEALAEETQAAGMNPPPGQWISNSGAAVTTGDYGTGTDTTITELFETLKYRGEKGEVGVTVPYLFRKGAGVTVGESRPARGAIPNDAQGLGDVQLKGKYFWLEEAEARPSVDLTGRIKLPTASEDKGLGTGRVDVGLGTELMKKLGGFITFGSLELVLRDKPSGSTIESTRLDYAAGIGYPFTERFTGYASLEGGTKSNSGADPPAEAVFSGVYRVNSSVSVNGYLLAGLTDGSPDFGGGTGVGVRF
ncbi:MAG: transporter [Candidatus Omnitrophica bacterium]|nr:transporter [Candidatus Omnitrophota bacterium]